MTLILGWILILAGTAALALLSLGPAILEEKPQTQFPFGLGPYDRAAGQLLNEVA